MRELLNPDIVLVHSFIYLLLEVLLPFLELIDRILDKLLTLLILLKQVLDVLPVALQFEHLLRDGEHFIL